MNGPEDLSRGFTLLEVMIGLLLAGIAVVGAAASFRTLSDQAGRMERVAEGVDHRRNAERVLRHLAANLRVPESSLSVAGGPLFCEFSSWCEAPASSLFPCRVAVRVEASGDETRLVLEIADENPTRESRATVMELWRARSARIRYLLESRNGGTWADSWSVMTLPLALGLVSDSSTLLLPLGR